MNTKVDNPSKGGSLTAKEAAQLRRLTKRICENPHIIVQGLLRAQAIELGQQSLK